MDVIPIILAGGAGTRLWPLSRLNYPKQFLSLGNELSLLQQTIERARSISPDIAPVVVCHEQYRFIVAEQAKAIAPVNILLEPHARNTSPAILLATMFVQGKYGDGCRVLVLPADHCIANENELHKAIKVAINESVTESIIIFGSKPNHAATDYGYIQPETRDVTCKKVLTFIEKPAQREAEEYLKEGYLWNSGMFFFRPNDLVSAYKQDAQKTYINVEQALAASENDLDFVRIEKSAYEACENISIDYQIMQKHQNVFVIPIDCGWSDIGSWNELKKNYPADENQNRICAKQVIFQDSKNNFVYSDKQTIAVQGCTNLNIIATKDAILVSNANQNNMRELVQCVKKENQELLSDSAREYRHWGHYDLIEKSHRSQVKKLVVKPKAALSLQLHHHRSEHWVVIKGSAKVIKGQESFILSEDESTYIPVGVKHQLHNPGNIPLEIIEIQTGSYLGEDDIVRFESAIASSSNRKY